MRKANILTFTMLIVLISGLSLAAPKKEAKAPIDISSDSLEATGSDIVFVGNVKAVYGDMTIKADKIQLYYEDKKKDENKAQEVKSIVANGNVEVIEINRHARADKMVYDRASGIATLTGKSQPRITQENNTIAGDTIKIFVDEDRYEAKGNVSVVVNPETLKE